MNDPISTAHSSLSKPVSPGARAQRARVCACAATRLLRVKRVAAGAALRCVSIALTVVIVLKLYC